MANAMRDWYTKLPSAQKKRLHDELLSRDEKMRVDYSEGFPQKIEADMLSMMNQLGELIEKSQPVLRGKIMQCGSSFNQTKIGKPDEMDFAFHWDLIIGSRSDLIVDICMRDGDKIIEGLSYVDKIFMDFTIKYPDDDNMYNYKAKIIGEMFEYALKEVLPKLSLLPGWRHGGYASPDCSGVRKSGPASMLQFTYSPGDLGLAGNDTEPLQLTVDFVLALDIREVYEGDLTKLCTVSMGPPWELDYLTRNHFLDKVFVKISNDFILDSSFAERTWLSTMKFDHPVKTAVRVCKMLTHLASQSPGEHMTVVSGLFEVRKQHMHFLNLLRRRMQTYPTCEDKARQLMKITEMLEQRPLKQLQLFDLKVPAGERFADVGEAVGSRPFVKSHVF